jgi:metallo-beta-lactamase class B
VGTAELSSILIATSNGLILIDGALPQSAALIDANIRALGFLTEDVRLIVSSHEHFDHVGGIAALQRASHAVVYASPSSAAALRSGKPTPDDPQYAVPDNGFPPVPSVRVVRDGATLSVGSAGVTAHFTPGHTPGGTTWSWRACERDRCLEVVYADSLNAVSSDDFLFTGGDAGASIVDSFENSIRTVADLPCDILLSPHSGFFGMRDKLQRLREGQADVFLNPGACRAYAGAAADRLEQRVAQERAAR